MDNFNTNRCVSCGAPGATPRSRDPFTNEPMSPSQLWHDHCYNWVASLGRKSRERHNKAGAA